MPVSALNTGGEAGTGMDWAGMKGTGLHALYVPQAKTGAVLQRTPWQDAPAMLLQVGV